MNTKGLFIFFGIPIFIITFLLFINNLAFLGADAIPKGSSLLQSSESENGKAPAPEDKELVKMFFDAVSAKEYSLALAMMDSSNFSKQEDVDEWANQLEAFESAFVSDVEDSEVAKWTEKEHKFKVVVQAKMNPESANAQIPYYGWSNGDNIKWITVRKGADGLWRILRIGSGM